MAVSVYIICMNSGRTTLILLAPGLEVFSKFLVLFALLKI